MSPDERNCSTSSALGTYVIIGFGVVYAIILITVSVYSYRFLNKYNAKFMSSSSCKKLKLWSQDVYKRRRCYIPIITHLLDQVTDFAVVIQFRELAMAKTSNDCGGLNMWDLFGLSIFVLLFYRIISSFLIFQSTKSLQRMMLQFVDLELFRALYVNYLCDKNEPCSPQRWITSLEATFESTPQALIQTIFLVKAGSVGDSYIVIFSVVMSLWTIISKIVSDDRIISVLTARRLSLQFAAYDCKKCACISWTFVCRYIWRILDVSSRIFICSLVWLFIGGWYLFFIIIFEGLALMCVCIYTKRFEFLFGIVAMVVSKSVEITQNISIGWMVYRCAVNIVLMSIITLLAYNDIHCWKCPTFEDRTGFLSSNTAVFIMFIYCWVAVVLIPILSVYLYNNVFRGFQSNARTIKAMLRSRDWYGILEMQSYKGDYGVYNAETGENLLMLAIQHNYGKLMDYISSNEKLDLSYKAKDGKSLLDYIILSKRNDNSDPNLSREYLGKLLITISNKDPYMACKEDENANLLLLAAYIGNINAYEKLASDAVLNYDAEQSLMYAIAGDEPQMINKYFFMAKVDDPDELPFILPEYTKDRDAFVKEMIAQQKPNILQFLIDWMVGELQDTPLDALKWQLMEWMEIWFYSAQNGSVRTIKVIQNFIFNNPNHNISDCDINGCTALHIACQRDADHRDLDVVNYLRRYIDASKKDNDGKAALDYLEKLEIPFNREYKIVVLGAGGVGKSALTVRLITGSFEANYDATIEDSYISTMDIDGHKCQLNVLDTAGQEQFAALQDHWMREGEIFLILFAIDSEATFEYAKQLKTRMLRTREDTSGPTVLVGHKVDLDAERKVSTEDAKKLVENWGSRENVYVEVSAKEDIRCKNCFEEAVRLWWRVNGYA
eukprot:756362_1